MEEIKCDRKEPSNRPSEDTKLQDVVPQRKHFHKSRTRSSTKPNLLHGQGSENRHNIDKKRHRGGQTSKDQRCHHDRSRSKSQNRHGQFAKGDIPPRLQASQKK